METSENKLLSPATARTSSTAGEPSAKVAGDETRADIVPLFGDEDTFVERLAKQEPDRAATEPIWFDEVLGDSELELVETRRELRKARSEINESRCELTQERARVDGLKSALELAIARARVLEARCAAEMDRATHAEDRACSLAAEADRREQAHEASMAQLEAQGASALAAAYLWFARLNR